MSTVMFLSLRVLHVLLASLWIGATFFISAFLMPAVSDAGPAGGQVMIGLNRKGLVPFFAAIGGTTVLTGIYLFWRFTSGFDPALSGSRAGIAYSIGGLAGLVAAILGGAVVGRSSKKIVAVMEQASKTSDGPKKAALMQEAAGLRQTLTTFGAVVIVCQVIALVLMAVAHYI